MRTLNVACIFMQYCKFPKGINTIEEFIDFLNKNFHSFVELEVFIEEGCVAPFYIEEDLKIEKQYLNPSNFHVVKEAEVFILPRTEYEERLMKAIAQTCVHCIHYVDNTCTMDPKPFIEKIDLDGDCYGFEKKQ